MARPKADIVGVLGLGWKVDIAAIAKGRPHGSVASWYVSAPWAHPLWECYELTCIHLRAVPGFNDPIIHLAGATHEVVLAAIDPEWQIDICQRARTLRPINFGAQFMAENDEAAAAMIEHTVREIVAGRLNPDTDFRCQWVERFGGNMLKAGALDPGTIRMGGDGIIVEGTGAKNARAFTGNEGKN